MNAIRIEYPESWSAVLSSSPETFEQEVRMALSVKLYEMGRITSGQAGQLAGISRTAFLLSCPQWGVPSVAWDKSEVEAEFQPLTP